MHYKPSEKYIESVRIQPARATIILACTITLLGYFMFSDADTETQDLVWPFAFVCLFVGAIVFVQIRRGRGAVLQLGATTYAVTDEGIVVEAPEIRPVVPLQAVQHVLIKRRLIGEGITQIALGTQEGEFALPELDASESFVLELRQRLGAVPFIERRSWP